MSIRIVRQKDDEILRKHSKDVSEITDRVKELILDMKDTMIQKGGCGLAAVQVGVLKKIIICDPENNGKIVTLINPEIINSSSEMVEDSEGCLSVDGYRGKVLRPEKIVVKARDEEFNEVTFEAEGFYARIICHEIDHLNGVLYTDKVVPGSLEDITEASDDENVDEDE